ncbi:MAG TPA: hypothetical protein EYP19_09875 [Desulfobacterales bacterium]|nr:hypothetical protein [Desulfobacterales bacterium]
MFPFAFEWLPEATRYVFMGALYTVLVTLVIILHYCAIRAFLDLICKKKHDTDTDHSEETA